MAQTLADIRAAAKAGKLKPHVVTSTATPWKTGAAPISTSATPSSTSKTDPLAALRAQIKARKSALSAASTTSATPTAEQLKTGRYPSATSKLQALQNLPLLERINRLEKLTANLPSA
jgi:hypothetical protein